MGKNLILLASVLVAILMASGCTQKTDEKIIGSWNAYFTEGSLLSGYMQGVYTFKNDGTFAMVNSDGSTFGGNYKIINESYIKAELLFYAPDLSKVTAKPIEFLDDDTFLWTLDNFDLKMYRTK